MEITSLTKNKAIKPQQSHEISADPVKAINTEENKKYAIKNKVDSTEISSSHNGSYEDKKLMIAKSAILYDVTVSSSTSQIEELKKAIDNDTYDVPSNLLADAIIE